MASDGEHVGEETLLPWESAWRLDCRDGIDER